MTPIDLCLKIATEAHRGQLDRSGDPVILHPLTVGLKGKNEAEICVGFLHDVIEDTTVTAGDMIEAGVPEEYVSSLSLLTRDKTVPYLGYVTRIAESGNPTAIAVKLNDLRHNLKRGVEKGYPELTAKHSSAWRVFIEHGLATEEELQSLITI